MNWYAENEKILLIGFNDGINDIGWRKKNSFTTKTKIPLRIGVMHKAYTPNPFNAAMIETIPHKTCNETVRIAIISNFLDFDKSALGTIFKEEIKSWKDNIRQTPFNIGWL